MYAIDPRDYTLGGYFYKTESDTGIPIFSRGFLFFFFFFFLFFFPRYPRKRYLLPFPLPRRKGERERGRGRIETPMRSDSDYTTPTVRIYFSHGHVFSCALRARARARARAANLIMTERGCPSCRKGFIAAWIAHLRGGNRRRASVAARLNELCAIRLTARAR